METGTISLWKEDQKFGFIKTSTIDKEVFFHRSDLKFNKEPRVGEVLLFDVRTNAEGKMRAINISFYKDLDEKKRTLIKTSVTLLVIPFIGNVLLLIHGIYVPLLAYLIAIPLSYYTYKDDKSRAQRRQWRTPEATLHLFDMLGGWYGGFCAQRFLFHKNKKGTFQLAFWTIVTTHLIVWIFVIIKIFQNNF